MEEVSSLLEGCLKKRDGGAHPHAKRNQAIILVLLDTGLRSTELCSLQIQDLDMRQGKLFVNKGKGARRRIVFIGNAARKAVWRYMAEREDRDDPDAPLFANYFGRAISREWLRKFISELGGKVGIARVYPHRFRFTFAIQYLRNGGDVFTLQRLLGHSSLKMVRYYLDVADMDSQAAHQRASPVDNWRL